MTTASFSAAPSLRSASAKTITPPFDVIHPPHSKAVVIFLLWTAGKAKDGDLSSIMADVAGEEFWTAAVAHVPEKWEPVFR